MRQPFNIGPPAAWQAAVQEPSMPEKFDQPKQKRQRSADRRKSLPRGPNDGARGWQPPGIRKDTPPPPVPHAVRNDQRQIPLLLE
jgi:hypothetical protein